MLDAVLLSDLHLGSDNCQARNICRLLERIHDGELPTARLILNGDVFDSIDFRRLTKHHWKVLSLIRKLSDTVEILWLAGNHDGSAEIVSHLLGVTVRDEAILESGPERILILHGHVFDAFIDRHPVLTWLADEVYRWMQWIDPTHAFARTAKHGSKTFLRNAQLIEDGAVELAKKRRCTMVCCGHTHHAVTHVAQPVPYFNSGCWTERPCHYLTVRAGVVALHAFDPDAAAPVPGSAAETPAVPPLRSLVPAVS